MDKEGSNGTKIRISDLRADVAVEVDLALEYHSCERELDGARCNGLET